MEKEESNTKLAATVVTAREKVAAHKYTNRHTPKYTLISRHTHVRAHTHAVIHTYTHTETETVGTAAESAENEDEEEEEDLLLEVVYDEVEKVGMEGIASQLQPRDIKQGAEV